MHQQVELVENGRAIAPAGNGRERHRRAHSHLDDGAALVSEKSMGRPTPFSYGTRIR
jgi:hypothetical protein